MAGHIGRRSNKDEKWISVKNIVRARDHSSCRLCQILTPYESKINSENSTGHTNNHVECAHVEAVSIALEKVYDPDNIFCLCPEHHFCMDHLTNPITNEHCDQNTIWYFWWRIKHKRKDSYDPLINYEDEYRMPVEEKSFKSWW